VLSKAADRPGLKENQVNMGKADGWGVIWDVDGTLVDTAELHYAAWVRLAEQLGKPFSRAGFTATFGRRNPEILRQLFQNDYSDAEVAQLGERKEELYREAAQQGVDLLAGARELLEDLRAAGFKQAIGSSAPRRNVDLILRLTRTELFFDAVVAMEDTQRGKPDPQVFLTAANRMELAPRLCLVLEDAVAGVEAARAGGMKCIAVTFVGHHSSDNLAAAGANLVVPTLEKVSAATVVGVLRS
jgi:beta-phosphoglucomutase